MPNKRVEFWTSTQYKGFLEGLMRELRMRGFDARQRFQISEASYRAAKSSVARLWLRARQYLIYPLQLMASLLWDRLRRKQADFCVVSTNTFYAPLLATYLHPNMVHLVYDLFPEAMVYSKKWREGSLKVKCARWITKQTLKRARRNVFLGQRLKDYVELQYAPLPNPAIIEVGADQSLFENAKNLESEKSGKLRTEVNILYCGNFGNMHDSATLFRYWNKITGKVKSEEGSLKGMTPDFNWRFYCSGPKRVELLDTCERLPDEIKNRIEVGSGLDTAEWTAAMKAADIALVTMKPGSETVVMPSKTYSAMMAGQAILAITPEESDLVDMIKTADCGWWVQPGDSEGLEQALNLICADTNKLSEKRKNACCYAHKHFGQNSLVAKWQELFECVSNGCE